MITIKHTEEIDRLLKKSPMLLNRSEFIKITDFLVKQTLKKYKIKIAYEYPSLNIWHNDTIIQISLTLDTGMDTLFDVWHIASHLLFDENDNRLLDLDSYMKTRLNLRNPLPKYSVIFIKTLKDTPKISINNYFTETAASWLPYNKGVALLEFFLNKKIYINMPFKFKGKKYKNIYISKSYHEEELTSCSYYFQELNKQGRKKIIRVSDHWTGETINGYYCGNIKTCKWRLPFYKLKKIKGLGNFAGGIISFKELRKQTFATKNFEQYHVSYLIQ